MNKDSYKTKNSYKAKAKRDKRKDDLKTAMLVKMSVEQTISVPIDVYDGLIANTARLNVLRKVLERSDESYQTRAIMKAILLPED